MSRIVLAFALFLVGCTDGAGGSGAADLGAPPDLRPAIDFTDPYCAEVADGAAAPAFADVERLLDRSCAFAGCHDDGAGTAVSGFDLRAGHSYASLVNAPAAAMCGGTRVVPGKPDQSFAYHKLVDAAPCSGLQMPRCECGSCPLPPCEIELVRRWIAAGATK